MALVLKQFFLLQDLLLRNEKKIETDTILKGRTSLCLTDQEAQKEILLGGPTPL